MALSQVKESKLLDLIARLSRRLGPDAFDIVDHWDGDLCAIGIASPSTHGFLAYLSTHNRPDGRYDVELETPPLPGTNHLYEPAGGFDDLDFEAVVQLVQEHLSRGVSPDGTSPLNLKTESK
jgi:hypothetical protein